MENESRDLALIAWREDGRWRVSKLPTGATNDIGLVLDALRAQQNNGGALAMLSIDDEFIILARLLGINMQMALSDVTTALDYEIAAEVLELGDIEFPVDEDPMEPAGDLNLFSDLGLDEMELRMICEDTDMYPEEQIEIIASRLGFAEELAEMIDGD